MQFHQILSAIEVDLPSVIAAQMPGMANIYFRRPVGVMNWDPLSLSVKIHYNPTDICFPNGKIKVVEEEDELAQKKNKMTYPQENYSEFDQEQHIAPQIMQPQTPMACVTVNLSEFAETQRDLYFHAEQFIPIKSETLDYVAFGFELVESATFDEQPRIIQKFERFARISPPYLSYQVEKSDVLFFSHSQFSKQTFDVLSRVLLSEILGLNVAFWDLELFRGISIDEMTQTRHRTSWVNQWIDKLLFFPLSNPMEFSKLIPQDILTHFVKPLPPKPIEDIQEIDENRTDSSLEEYFAFDSGIVTLNGPKISDIISVIAEMPSLEKCEITLEKEMTTVKIPLKKLYNSNATTPTNAANSNENQSSAKNDQASNSQYGMPTVEDFEKFIFNTIQHDYQKLSPSYHFLVVDSKTKFKPTKVRNEPIPEPEGNIISNIMEKLNNSSNFQDFKTFELGKVTIRRIPLSKRTRFFNLFGNVTINNLFDGWYPRIDEPSGALVFNISDSEDKLIQMEGMFVELMITTIKALSVQKKMELLLGEHNLQFKLIHQSSTSCFSKKDAIASSLIDDIFEEFIYTDVKTLLRFQTVVDFLKKLIIKKDPNLFSDEGKAYILCILTSILKRTHNPFLNHLNNAIEKRNQVMSFQSFMINSVFFNESDFSSGGNDDRVDQIQLYPGMEEEEIKRLTIDETKKSKLKKRAFVLKKKAIQERIEEIETTISKIPKSQTSGFGNLY